MCLEITVHGLTEATFPFDSHPWGSVATGQLKCNWPCGASCFPSSLSDPESSRCLRSVMGCGRNLNFSPPRCSLPLSVICGLWTLRDTIWDSSFHFKSTGGWNNTERWYLECLFRLWGDANYTDLRPSEAVLDGLFWWRWDPSIVFFG